MSQDWTPTLSSILEQLALGRDPRRFHDFAQGRIYCSDCSQWSRVLPCPIVKQEW